MVRIELEKFFERLFSDQPGSLDDLQSGAVRSALSAAMAQRSSVPPADDAAARIGDLAAHLDGAGDAAFIAKLARDPEALYGLESAQAFLDRMSVEEERSVPAELMRVAVAEADPESVIPVARHRRRPAPYLLWGSAIAALLLLAVAGNSVYQNVTRTNIASAPSSVSGAQPSSQNQPTAAVGDVQPVLPSDASIANPPESPVTRAVPRVYTTPNPPVPLTNHAVTAADYPAVSARLQEQGTVKVKYLVLTDGTVGDCQVEMSSGYERLDDSACTIVRGWLFKPASVIGGTPIAMWLDADIVYRLGNGAPPPATAYAAPPPPKPPVALTSHAVTADDYPPVSIRLQEQGVVHIKYLVKEDGTVSDCAVQIGSGKSRLDDAACTMAKRRWKFKPATQNGKSVSEYLLADVVFMLQ